MSAELVPQPDPVMVAQAIVSGTADAYPEQVRNSVEVGNALVTLRREVMTRTADAVFGAVGEGLAVARKHVRENQDDVDTALAMVRAAAPMMPKGPVQVELNGHGGAGAELVGQVEWLLQVADAHRVRLLEGAAAVLDGDWEPVEAPEAAAGGPSTPEAVPAPPAASWDHLL